MPCTAPVLVQCITEEMGVLLTSGIGNVLLIRSQEFFMKNIHFCLVSSNSEKAEGAAVTQKT